MTEEILLGFVGLGGICRERHVPGFKKISDVKIIAVANRSRPSSERAARDYGIPEVCDTWRDIVAHDGINTVVIGTWPYMHCEVSVAALKAGKHVFCQARMARNRQEAELMYDAACFSDQVAALCPVPIGMRFDRVIARILREDIIGSVRYANVRSFSSLWVDAATPMTWRKDHHISGLNMQTFGMYIEVIHRWLGNTRRVSAETFLYTPERRDESGAFATVHIPDQMAVNTIVGDGLPVHYIISGVSGVAEDAIDIYGDKGALHYDANNDILYLKRNGTMEPVQLHPAEEYDLENWTVEADFVAAVREGVPYHPDFADGLRYMRVLQAAYDSAASGQHINLPQDI
ncbi:MAG TPA: Gfo/Idh/MocA family oxidoreductase [Candidatus Hydrogenedentes bacterium]|nr:Gfo/Idh/MocA family oxidoreductase [Candidatus Hydrogenedentota bacterium]